MRVCVLEITCVCWRDESVCWRDESVCVGERRVCVSVCSESESMC